VELVVAPVVDSSYPSNRLSAIPPYREEVLGFRMLEERVLLLRQQLTYVHTQRGDPVWVPSVQSVWKGNELPEVGSRLDRLHDDR